MKKNLTFEQAIERLDEIANRLDSGQPLLDEALKLFSEGAELVAFCDEKLKKAKIKVETLFCGAGGANENSGDGTEA